MHVIKITAWAPLLTNKCFREFVLCFHGICEMCRPCQHRRHCCLKKNIKIWRMCKVDSACSCELFFTLFCSLGSFSSFSTLVRQMKVKSALHTRLTLFAKWKIFHHQILLSRWRPGREWVWKVRKREKRKFSVYTFLQTSYIFKAFIIECSICVCRLRACVHPLMYSPWTGPSENMARDDTFSKTQKKAPLKMTFTNGQNLLASETRSFLMWIDDKFAAYRSHYEELVSIRWGIGVWSCTNEVEADNMIWNWVLGSVARWQNY